MTMKSSQNAFEFLINHVVFPAKLPQQEEDPDMERSGEKVLLQLLSESLNVFLGNLIPEAREKWRPVCGALNRLQDMTDGGLNAEAIMENNFQNLKSDGAMIIYIRAQNTGLLLFHDDSGNVLAHAFEASAVSKNVMESCDRLIWRFPGQTIGFGSHLLNDKAFTHELATMLQQMGNEPVESSMPNTRKAQSDVPEERETVHPRLVTEGLIPMLCAWGQAWKSPEIIKHVRDDVNWDNSRLPWRRSPLWLVLRVSVQILLSYSFPEDQGRQQYKNFMAFFMARICTKVGSEQVSADVRMISAVKAARRLSKLGDKALPCVEEATQSAVATIRAGLDSSWSEFQVKQLLPIPKLSRQATDDDCILRLKKSRQYLQAVSRGRTERPHLPGIDLEAGPRLEFKADGLPRLHRTTNVVQHLFILTDFEMWVMEDLHSWTKSRQGTPADCDSLLVELHTYLDSAREEYKENPRALSVMLLVILEIWRNLDTLCLQLYPLMRKFSPEIPVQFGQPLLLPHQCQMKTLDRIETYLASRWRESEPSNPSILGELSPESFCVRFYAQSEAHWSMRKKIEEEADRKRAHKRSEWVERSEEYQRLSQTATGMVHSYWTNRWGDSVHAGYCEKCRTQDKADNMRIDVHEWPLPTDEVQAKAVIFELDCPSGFSAWRDATWLIIQDLGRAGHVHASNVQKLLLEYGPLIPYARNSHRTITLASHTKSFLNTHYKNQRFPVEFEKIAVRNGLKYELLDTSENTCWVHCQKTRPCLDRHCVSLLPDGPYSNLQEFVNTPSHTPNESLAAQQKCHAGISFHEFLAFASLRAGERIQWLNIIRELGSADLSFNSTAVYVLTRQAALQAGSRDEHTVLRAAHAHFEDPAFCDQLIQLLESHLYNINSNWKEQSRLAMVALLGLRVLTLSSHSSIASRTIQMLRQVRNVALSWCREIHDTIHKCTSEDESQRIRNFINMSALTCRMTYDTDHSNINLVLNNPCDVACFVESSIYINDNYSAHQYHVPVEVQQATLLDRKLSRDLQPRLKELIEISGSGVNSGIMNAYGLTGLDGQWNFLSGKENRWISSTLTFASDDISQSCHYDTLLGTFLLDGRRVGRLPPEYMSASIYGRIFGSRILTVTRSRLDWMEYKVVKLVEGHEVHLTMDDGELLVEAFMGSLHLRLITHTVLEPDLPKSLSEDFVHWMNMESDEIEFRPLASPWKSSGRTWKLHFYNSGGSHMDMDSRRLLDQESHLGKVILDIFQTLELRITFRLSEEGSRDVEVDLRGRSFPIITFLNQKIGATILDRVVGEIQRGKLLGVSLSHCTTGVRQAVVTFIRERSVPQPILALVQQEFGSLENWKILLLLRGLIANGILLFAFQQKRWLVNYGLDLSRCMMAVPYRAKGVPSISAEFGHPDVAITLTCLSYYYTGLTPEQLRKTFENLFRESDPDSEYELWVQDCPSLSVRSLHGINLEDERSWENSIYPQLRFSKSAADYFMTSVVFPHEEKEFPTKLSTSAWDIPSEIQPSTGFSGTNDNKFLLPLSIRQNDLPQLHRTNAMVANLLLQQENREYKEAKDTSGKQLSTEGLLGLLCSQSSQITVLIDVGAQVLEANNENVARQWLQLSPEAHAAVFFDESDELRVADWQGFVEQLSSSAFHRNLDKCLIYLDEVHTRGVDISIPTHARAAVTLGPRTTKDRLVQACMRMRKLGCHQSLIFFAPPEVHKEILALSGKQPDAKLDSGDVLHWSFEQTCRSTSSIKPLWIMQGLEHGHRRRLCAKYLQESALEPSQIAEFCTHLEEPEGRTLDEMYGGSGQAVFRSCLTDQEARHDPIIQLLLSEWDTFKESHSRDWSLQEEQEREIAHEVEQERQLQRPPPMNALPHAIDPSVRRFIETGRLDNALVCPFQRAFDSLRQTSAFQYLHADAVADTLLVTNDFARTVDLAPCSSSDEFVRPAKWVLTSRIHRGLLLVISPYEANTLLPAIQKSSEVGLHIYSAKTSKAMHRFHDLKFYTVSGSTQLQFPDMAVSGQLGLFAGSLFFEDFAAYRAVTDFLAILIDAAMNEEEVLVGSDGFVNEDARKRLSWPVASPFKTSPVVFIKALIGIRRKGHVYSQTHLGHLLSGRFMAEDAFQRA